MGEVVAVSRSLGRGPVGSVDDGLRVAMARHGGSTRDKPSVSVSGIRKRSLDSYVKTG